MKIVTHITTAFTTVFSRPKYLLTLVVLTLLSFLSLVMIPVKSIPGNDLTFQLSIFTFWNYVLMIFLSTLLSAYALMQFYLIRTKAKNLGVRATAKSGIAGVSGILAAIFGTAACSSCVALIFGFLGPTAVLFLLYQQWYIVAIGLSILLISLYFIAKQISNDCLACEVPAKHNKKGG